MKQKCVFRNRKTKLRANKKGGIEGLPLQLLIIIVVASLGLAMMIGWMNDIEEPSTISDVQASYQENADGAYDITISVYDQNGNPVEGADVVVTGYGAHMIKITETKNEGTLIGYKVGNSMMPLAKIQEYNLMDMATPVYEDNGSTVTTEKIGTPHGVTGSDGTVTITVGFDNLKTYGTLNIEASKTGYTGTTATMKVFA